MTSMKNPIEEAIIMKIRKLRLERNISQMALSDILNVSDGQIGNIESSRFQHKYTLKQIYTFAHSLIILLKRCFFLMKN